MRSTRRIFQTGGHRKKYARRMTNITDEFTEELCDINRIITIFGLTVGGKERLKIYRLITLYGKKTV